MPDLARALMRHIDHYTRLKLLRQQAPYHLRQKIFVVIYVTIVKAMTAIMMITTIAVMTMIKILMNCKMIMTIAVSIKMLMICRRGSSNSSQDDNVDMNCRRSCRPSWWLEEGRPAAICQWGGSFHDHTV